MKHLAAEWERSRGVGGSVDGRPDLADDSVNGVITTIPLSLHYKQEVTNKAVLALAVSSPSSLHLSPSCAVSLQHLLKDTTGSLVYGCSVELVFLVLHSSCSTDVCITS